MYRKVITILVVVISVKIFIGCCTEDITFTNVKFRAVHYDSHWQEVESFDKNIVFRIFLYQDRIAFFNSFQYKAYATSCGHDYQNKMDTATIELKASKQIIFDQDTIIPNDNLWTNRIVKKYIKLTEDEINPEFVWIIKINDEVLRKMKFESDKYNFSFRVKMTDNQIISDTTSVFIKI